MSDEENSTRSGIERAMQIIFQVAASREPDVGVTELARELGLSKAVVHRVVRTLVATGFFAVDEKTRRYRLGPGAASVGLAALAQIEVPKVAQPYLERLVARTNETATLSGLYGDQRMYLSQVLSPQEIRMSVPLGRLFPLHAGGSSKAILSAFDPERQRQYIKAAALDSITQNTITDADRLLSELAEIASRGYAVSLGERQADAASVASPIWDSTGQVRGSISVCGPVSRIDARMVSVFGPLVAEAAGNISRELGYRGHELLSP